MTELELRSELCEAGRRLWQKDLIGGAEGNLSVRLSPQRILCTPSGVSKGHLKPNQIVVIDQKGNPVGEGKPSSEIKMHVRAYAERPDCVAIVHAHPPIATAFALAGEEIPDNLLPEAAIVLGSVPIIPFAMPGTYEVPDSLEPYLADHKTFLLSNHGALALGKSVFDALHRMETLERIAQVVFLARQIDRPRPMPDEAFSMLLKSALNGKL
jgi:L-fuculose-phosphate aldolase